MKTFLFRSTCLRWMIVATAFALGACSDTPMKPPAQIPDDGVELKPISVPPRKIDMLFVVDNSAGMSPIHKKFSEVLPTLLNALRDDSKSPPLPDLRMAIITSDVGAGQSVACVPNYGDRGQLRMRGECGQNPGARWLANSPNDPNGKTYAGDDPAKVLGCLVMSVGSGGCGYEQPLQSIRFALEVEQGNGVAVKDFIRPDAFLVIVLLTDEDDCSMPIDSVLASADLSSTEAPSLRCATRGHQCAGAPLAYPTLQSFVADYATCAARTDYCTDQERAENSSACTPLANIKDIATTVKEYKLKNGGSDDMVLVVAIFGTPLDGHTGSQYKIDRYVDPATGQSGLFDLSPVCVESITPSTIYYAGNVGFAGLRIQSFLDQFPKESTLGFSVCESDYAPALTRLGNVLRTRMDSVCIRAKLKDTNPATVGVQPVCTVREVLGSQLLSTELPWCGSSNTLPCWRVESNPEACPATAGIPSQQVVVDRPAGYQPAQNQSIRVDCQTCAPMKPGVDPNLTGEGCAY